MINVLCVYKSGGPYDMKYVVALKRGLELHAPAHRFYCLTDVPWELDGICDTIALKDNLDGWWSKIELFRFEMGRCLYFDLDVLPLKNLTPIFRVCEWAKESEFIALRGFDPLAIENNWPSSSIMSWCGNRHKIYEEFHRLGVEAVLKEARTMTSRAGQRTDQGFIRKVVPNTLKFQDCLLDGYILSKYDYYKDKEAVRKASILNWTGKPRLHAQSTSTFGHIWTRRWESCKK
jgi:hypothetical protein